MATIKRRFGHGSRVRRTEQNLRRGIHTILRKDGAKIMPKYINADEILSEESEAYTRLKQSVSNDINNDITSPIVFRYVRMRLKQLLDDAPAADVVEVVRCKDCKFYIPEMGFCEPNEFCSRGEIKKDNAEIH